MPWRAFRARNGLVLIEWLRRPNPNNVPRSPVIFPKTVTFSCRPSGTAFKHGFGTAAPGLDDLYGQLEKQKAAGTLSAVAIHSALLLHELVERPVLSIASDDEDWDLACEVRDDSLNRLIFRSGDQERLIDHTGNLSSTDMGPRILHHIARREAARWSPDLSVLFGFDGSPDELGLKEIDRARQSSDISPTPPSPPTQRPFWRFW